jgi:3-oxoacyl-[acyl-carrier protein] reductase
VRAIDLGLQDRTAIVCGASSGLGLACAEALAAEGANVVMVARRERLLRKEAQRIGGHPVVSDVRDPAMAEVAVQAAIARFGALDVIVATDMDATAVQDAVELLLLPVVRLVRAGLPHLVASDQGRIVLISSIAAREPLSTVALSSAVRPGVVGYLKTLSRELGPHGVTVNCVGPGRFATDRLHEFGDARPSLDHIPLNRAGEPRELADLVTFLCSRRAGYLTGTFIPVDGGTSHSLM